MNIAYLYSAIIEEIEEIDVDMKVKGVDIIKGASKVGKNDAHKRLITCETLVTPVTLFKTETVTNLIK